MPFRIQEANWSISPTNNHVRKNLYMKTLLEVPGIRKPQKIGVVLEVMSIDICSMLFNLLRAGAKVAEKFLCSNLC